jgi:YD repeat-containing protein
VPPTPAVTAGGRPVAACRLEVMDRITDALGNMAANAYDKTGNVTAVTDALNRTTTHLYDALTRQRGGETANPRRLTS